MVVWICCRLKGAAFVIDWHNLGYSILALSLGPRHPLVKVGSSASSNDADEDDDD